MRNNKSPYVHVPQSSSLDKEFLVNKDLIRYVDVILNCLFWHLESCSLTSYTALTR